MSAPFVSICIPTYNRTKYLPRLLDSIIAQTYKNYDIIVTDNTEDDRIKELLKTYESRLNIRYHKNQPALNMTGNWNQSFSMADGEWIKLMHDDDWFATETALQDFVDATQNGKRFIYSGRIDFDEDKNTYTPHVISKTRFEELKKNPLLLYADNIIGPPTLLMFHSSVKEYYDDSLQWFVDMEYYIRMLQKEDAVFIHKPLVNISYHNVQVTNFCFNNPAIQIPEILYIAKEYGLPNIKSDIRVYDAFWRMMRNLNIRSQQSLEQYAAGKDIPDFFQNIVKHQQLIPQKLLKIGFISKLAMSLSYIL